MYIKKLFISFLIVFSLIAGGCAEEKNSINKNDTSSETVTELITDSVLSESNSTTSFNNKNTTAKGINSKSENEYKTAVSASSSAAKVSEKTNKIKKTKTAKTHQVNKSTENTTQRQKNRSLQTTYNQNIQNSFSKQINETQEKNEFSISIEIECKSALEHKDLSDSVILPQSGIILPKTEIKIKSGQSALDVTKTICEKMNIPIVCINKSYIKSIGPIGEKQCGKFSGWSYKINGKKPSKSSDKYVLNDNDILIWSFVTTY